MKKLFISLPLLTILISTFIILLCDQTIIPIKSFREVNFSTIKPNTLVIFDVDETLIQPVDSYLVNEYTPRGQSFMHSLPPQYPSIATQEWLEISSIMLQEAQRPLLEPFIVNEIQQLQARNVTVIACTSMNTGPYGKLASLEQWRYEHLTSLGFQASFNNFIIPLISFKRKPIFYRGILCTDLELKGPVIGAFLDTQNIHPTEIIMFDDSKDYLLSVKDECKKKGIRFKGYEYQGAHQKVWDDPVIKFQAEYLIKNRTWISDEQVHAYINNNPIASIKVQE